MGDVTSQRKKGGAKKASWKSCHQCLTVGGQAGVGKRKGWEKVDKKKRKKYQIKGIKKLDENWMSFNPKIFAGLFEVEARRGREFSVN